MSDPLPQTFQQLASHFSQNKRLQCLQDPASGSSHSAPTVALLLLLPPASSMGHSALPRCVLAVPPPQQENSHLGAFTLAVPSTWKILSPEILLAHPFTSCPSLLKSHYSKSLPWPPYLILHTTPALRGTWESPNLLYLSLFYSVVIFKFTRQCTDLPCLLVINKIKYMVHHHHH